MTKVLVIDDQRIAREYMENVVKNGGDYELVGSLSKADLAETVCRRSQVDLVLMDVCTHGTKDGIDAAAQLRRLFPKLKMIVVTSMVEESYIKRAREAGVDSFWYKEISPEDLITVMDATMQGRQIWPGETPTVKLGVTTSDDFTEIEIKVLRLVCEGLEYSEIAEKLNYTKDNVKYHIRNILQKTGYANKTQLAIAVTGKRYIIPKLFDEQDDSEENPIVL
ncbi:response regulator transcription factor [Lachnospiraceae bacterium HCP28S3_F9]|uniref:response regulator transcription factor n=1 Tax=Clostridia TaxID=186801 RepID=UPI001D0644E0|nr:MULTISPECIES: response regulator transcription factor [Clostridia]MDY4207204.1 response regulator transcription factor [Lachnospiraceae bacterium]MDY5026703.1 response regulator transcription factor [Oliverpabstia sp.]MCB6661282.1 response regulator transcription factor [Eubacterium callanderi]MCB6754178.1 response regulator transcription factor [Eubacterium callanderi]MCB7103609.1 response regulator transcription factor [Eubacterium callanderi]